MTKEESTSLTVADAQMYFPASSGFVSKCIELQGDESALVAYRDQNGAAIKDIKEFIARSKFAASQAEAFLKTLCTPSPDTLPDGVKWNKQSYTTTFSDPMAAVKKLVEIEGTPIENFAAYVTPKQAAEAAGITEARLRADVGEYIVDTPKARVLNIK
ncbi:MAG: hypothetical protein HUK19_08290 [Fibrobacter sp.]|nr:hypothetical protein [Fibrobacter sp.]